MSLVLNGVVITPEMFLIVCPMLFLAGVVDSVAGGGGLISLPAYLMTGIPVHNAIATNKLSSTMGTALTTGRFIRNGLINMKVAVPSIMTGIVGSVLGSHLSMMIPEKIMEKVLIGVLIVAATIVLNKKLFYDNGSDTVTADFRTVSVSMISALVIGIYDGLYGPGTGSFLIIVFTVFAKLSMKSSNAQAKIINATTNITALAVFLINGKTVIVLGLAGAICNMIGNYVGSGMVLKNGAKVVKPMIIFVLSILFIKVIVSQVS